MPLRTETTLEEFHICETCGAELHEGDKVMVIGDMVCCLEHDGGNKSE